MKYFKISLEICISILLTTLASCKSELAKIPDNIVTNKNPKTSKSLEKCLTDSLFKYIHLTTFTQRADLFDTSYVMHGVQLDSSKVGIIAIEDKKLMLFQQFGKEVKLIDSFAFTDWARSFDVTDLNEDRKEDFIVYGSWDVHGNNYPYVFICDSTNVLHYRKDLQLPNISYEYGRHLVRSFWIGGACDVHTKNLYRWENDSLEKVASVELDLTHENMKPIETRFYKNKNGKMVLYKRVKDPEENIFDTALFREY